MSCDIDALAEAARCFSCMDENLRLACEVQLLANWAGSTDTPDQILARASASKFTDLEPGLQSAAEAQLLCNILTP